MEKETAKERGRKREINVEKRPTLTVPSTYKREGER